MSSIIRPEDSDPSSGYDGDVSDEVSDASTVVNETKPTELITDTHDKQKHDKNEKNDENDKNDKNPNPEMRTICIGCDARDAGPGVTNDEDAEFGTIWIGCSVRDMGFRTYQEYLAADDEPSIEHIEDVGKLENSKDSNKQAGGDNSKESRNCKQKSR